MTFEQVKIFSEMATIEVVRDWPYIILLIMYALFFSGMAIYMCVDMKKAWAEKKLWKDWGYTGGAMVLLIVTVAMSAFVIWLGVTSNMRMVEGADVAYKVKQMEWTHEYVTPYIEQLPTEKMEVKQVKRNYLLELEGTKTALEQEYDTPIETVTKTGETITGWAQIKPLEEGETERIEFVKLEEDLFFGDEEYRYLLDHQQQYPKGYYRIVVYSNTIE